MSESWIQNGKTNKLKSFAFKDDLGFITKFSDANGNEWVQVIKATCFSCDKQFELEDHNDRDEGYFCDDCLENKEGR